MQRAEQAQVGAVDFVPDRNEARGEVAIGGQRQFRDLEQRLEAPQRDAPPQHVRVRRGFVPALLLDADGETERGGIAGDGGQRLGVVFGAGGEAEIRVEQ